MKTSEQIILIIESERNKSYKLYNKWKGKDDREAKKHLVSIHTIDRILDEIDQQEEVAQILESMPEQHEPKKSFLYYYVNFYSFFMFATSAFFVVSIIPDIKFMEGIFGSIFGYVLLLIHFASYYATMMFSHLTLKKTE